MSSCAVEGPRVLHRLPGRLRVSLGDLSDADLGALETTLHGISGVDCVQVNRSTGNLLVKFDPQATSETRLLSAFGRETPSPVDPDFGDDLRTGAGDRADLLRAHITGKAVEDPDLARQVARRLRALPNVSKASADSSGVVVEYSADDPLAKELVAQVARVRADVEAERSAETASATRLAEAALELAIFAVRRVRDGECLSRMGVISLVISGTLGAVEAVPPLRSALRRRLGESGARIVLDAIEALGLGLSGGWVGFGLCAVKVMQLIEGASAPTQPDDGEGEAEAAAPMVVIDGRDVSVCHIARLAEAA